MVSLQEQGIALVGADGLWSTVRKGLGHRAEPHFAGHTAWRALIPAAAAPVEFSRPAINLWIGRQAHLVHYPVKAGTLINVVAILRDRWNEPGWNAPGLRRELLDRFGTRHWHGSARAFLGLADEWRRWALFDHAPLSSWGQGPTTLLGDAAHPMLPYLAQGGAMAIEDAAVLANCLAQTSDNPAAALRNYEQHRHKRTALAQRAARRNGMIYHFGNAAPLLLRIMGYGGDNDRLIRRYDWVYGWTP
jgi:salicylate hydroxylase